LRMIPTPLQKTNQDRIVSTQELMSSNPNQHITMSGGLAVLARRLSGGPSSWRNPDGTTRMSGEAVARFRGIGQAERLCAVPRR
jgi:hypothetical protein